MTCQALCVRPNCWARWCVDLRRQFVSIMIDSLCRQTGLLNPVFTESVECGSSTADELGVDLQRQFVSIMIDSLCRQTGLVIPFSPQALSSAVPKNCSISSKVLATGIDPTPKAIKLLGKSSSVIVVRTLNLEKIVFVLKISKRVLR